jgi:hypothetical protein
MKHIMTVQCSAVQEWGLDWLEQAAMLSVTLMIIDIDKISLVLFDGPPVHDIFNKIIHSELLPIL